MMKKITDAKFSLGTIAAFLVFSLLSSLWLGKEFNDAFTTDGVITASWILHFVILLILLIGIICFRADIPYEKIFLAAAIPIGLAYMLMITPLSPPDEMHHYQASYQLSNQMIFKTNAEYGSGQDFDYADYPLHTNSSVGYERLFRDIGKARAEDEETIIPEPRSFTYFAAYLPQAVGIAAAKIFHANFIILFYSGRLTNLLFYLFCLYFAIRETPKHKMLFFGIGLMPMALQQAASYSYDGFTNGMAILFTALCLKAIIRKDPMQKKEYFVLLITGIFLAPAKVGYALLVLLFILIPKERFRKAAEKWIGFAVLALSMAGFIALFWLFPALNGTAVNELSAEHYTVEYLLQNPIHAIEIIVNSVKQDLIKWGRESIGWRLSGLNLILPEYVIWLYSLLLFAVSLKSDAEPFEPGKNRWVYVLIFFICSLLAILTEFVTWTPIEAAKIEGIQGRYYIPVLPLLFFAFDSLLITKSKKTDQICGILMIALHVLAADNILAYTLAV